MPKMNTLVKVLLFTAGALLVLGLIKKAAPDFWAKIPGLNAF